MYRTLLSPGSEHFASEDSNAPDNRPEYHAICRHQRHASRLLPFDKGDEGYWLALFNPLEEPIEREVLVPLYYPGLKDIATDALRDADAHTVQLD
ncbi:MAG: hypothetical protein ACK2U9_24780, partial [Anaerolineae bacterium]